MAINPMTGYPDWVDYYAKMYGVGADQIWANALWGNSASSTGHDSGERPGSDINLQTGRTASMAGLAPGETWQQDRDRQYWSSGNSHTPGKLVTWGIPALIGGMAGFGALGAAGMLGAGAADLGGGAAAAGMGAAPGEAAGAFAGSFPSEFAGAGAAGGGVYGPPAEYAGTGAADLMGPSAEYAGVAPGTTPYGPPGAYAGSGTSAPAGGTNWSQLLQRAGGAATALNGSSGSGSNQNGGTGSLIGGLVGAGLGYLDSASQPDSLTTSQTIDPRLAQFAYGPNGTAAMAQQAAAANGGQYLANAGQQISQLGQNGPTPYNDLVKNNQALWSANPFIEEQRKAITDTVNRNTLENVMPNIGSQANSTGGYGGSRQGIAQGLAISRSQGDLAQPLANLASNAWENSQNRAQAGANYQGQYGLAGTQQQANLLQTGANMQASAPWFNATQFGNITHQMPGNTSNTIPLFNNPYAAALGGAQTGSQWAGNVDWGQLVNGIGGLFKG